MLNHYYGSQVRFLLAKRIAQKTAIQVSDGMIELLKSVPEGYVLSVAPDWGKEFSLLPQITEALNGMPFYFPKPHAPWERGTNENTNGLIREYFPKSIDMNIFEDSYIYLTNQKINLRPRKCLDWKSPYEDFYDEMLHLT